MMTTRLLLIPVLSAVLAGCHGGPERDSGAPTSQPTSRPAAGPVAGGPMLDAERFEFRGAGVRAGETLEASTVVANAVDHAGKELRVTGVVRSVCKKKGCWMRLGEPEGEQLFVRFKDYGFFVPVDCEGRRVVMEGTLNVAMQSVAEQRHYLEDEGKHAEAKAVTEPKQVVSFLATGVALAKP